MKLTQNTIRIILDDFIIKLINGEITSLDFDNLFALADGSGNIISPNVREFLEGLRDDLKKKEQSKL